MRYVFFSIMFMTVNTNRYKISLFVKSKSGEIERRVRHCESIIDSITKKDALSQQDDKSRQKLVFLLKQEILRLTRDLERLSRFVGVQRTGFRKLLKKYKKWSQSTQLSDRFLPILEAPTSFTNQDFTSVFLELSLLYDILRQARTKHQIVMPAPAQYPDNEALCKFDCQMVTAVSQSEVFWVHPDNVMQIKVALLRHLELVSDDSVSSISNPQSTTAEPSQSFAIYLDNAKKFNSIQTRSEPGQVRWVFSPGSSNSTHVLCSPVGGLRHFCLASLSSSQFDFIRRAQFDSLSKEIAAEQHQLSKLALTWVKRRKAVPIANAAFSRSRFRYIDPNPSSNSGDQAGADLFSTSPTSNMDVSDLWATLDTNIELSKAGAKSGDQDETQFPYALLEVRYKGMDKPDWLAELETSHLVYQVDGFSLYAHSVALFYSNALSRLPSWMEFVEEGVDIRKTPKRQAQPSLQSA